MKKYSIYLIAFVITFLAASIAFAAGWSSKANLSNSTDWSSSPDIVSTGNKVYVVWTESTDVYFKWYNGSKWQSKVKVNTTEYGACDKPRIAVGYGKISIVWEELINSQYEIFFRRFDGSKWSSAVNVSKNSGHSTNPKIVSYYKNSYIVWEEDSNKDFTSDEIFYRRFDGSNWYSKGNVSASSSNESSEPAISIDNGRLRVVWTEVISGNREIYFRFFTP